MKVYCVFQSFGSYEEYFNELKYVCQTKEKAEKLKKELDKMVVSKDELFSIIPEEIYENWPFTCDDEENDIWSPYFEYEGYTLSKYIEQTNRIDNYNREYYPSEIEEYDLL